MLSNVVRYNVVDNPTKQAALSQYDRPKALCRYAEIARHLGIGGKMDADSVEKLLQWLEQLKVDLDIPASIQATGGAEADFMAQVDKLAEMAFDDQCTGANPGYPLIAEIRQVLIASYYGHAYVEGQQDLPRAEDRSVIPMKAKA